MLSNNIRRKSNNDVFTRATLTSELTGGTVQNNVISKSNNVVNLQFRVTGMTEQKANGTIAHIPLEYAPIQSCIVLGFARWTSDSSINANQWTPIFVQIERGGVINFYVTSAETAKIDTLLCFATWGC